MTVAVKDKELSVLNDANMTASNESNGKTPIENVESDAHFSGRSQDCGANLDIAKVDFRVGDVVWAKISRYPHWPAKIERIYGVRNRMVELLWINDYRRTKVYKTQLQDFLKNFDSHREMFLKHVGLEAAAKEAMIYIGCMRKK